jgi:hypothetical protein
VTSPQPDNPYGSVAQVDGGMAAIAARFGVGVGAAAGQGAADLAADAAGMPPRAVCKRPIYPFGLPPGLIVATAVGSYLDLPHQFGPRTGWYWDITSLTVAGFTAGAIAVSINGPWVNSGGTIIGLESVASFPQAGVQPFPQKGMPLLDSSERLVFTVTAAITGSVLITGRVVMVPAERIDEYLS